MFGYARRSAPLDNKQNPVKPRARTAKSLLPRNTDGSLKHLFRPLDVLATSWQGSLDAFGAFLESPDEKARRRKELDIIMSRAEFRELAIRQLEAASSIVLNWERSQIHEFRIKQRTFVIERIVMVLECVVAEIAPRRWPELENLVIHFKSIASRTAPFRFCLMKNRVLWG
jgi:hypothetical protein